MEVKDTEVTRIQKYQGWIGAWRSRIQSIKDTKGQTEDTKGQTVQSHKASIKGVELELLQGGLVSPKPL